MTYKQVKKQVQGILESHAMIGSLKFSTPSEWLKREEQGNYPLCCYAMNGGGFDAGYKTFNIQLWFLDKAGVEGEFEVDVVSDQLEIANDIITLLKQSHELPWIIDEDINYSVILEKFEDYLSGVQLEITLKILNNYDTCIVPVV